jgi:hypothetical protein
MVGDGLMDWKSAIFAFQDSQNTESPLPHEIGAALYHFRICDPIAFSQPVPEFGVICNAKYLGAEVSAGPTICRFKAPEGLELLYI